MATECFAEWRSLIGQIEALCHLPSAILVCRQASDCSPANKERKLGLDRRKTG